MGKAEGYIKLHRQILEWGWYSDIRTFRLFIHLLLKANYKDLVWEGHKILRGQLVTSLPKLASQTGLTERQVRVSLDKLKMTGEVSDKATNKYRIITVIKYDEYQTDDRQNGRQMTDKMSDKRQASDRQMTDKCQTNDRQMTASKEYKEREEYKEKEERKKEIGTASRFTPPTREEIIAFCEESGLEIDVDRFIDYYTANGWMIGKNKMKDWKATVRNWYHRDQKEKKTEPVRYKRVLPAQDFDQRDYGDYDAMRSVAADIAAAREAGII